jgi:hypothetical protein
VEEEEKQQQQQQQAGCEADDDTGIGKTYPECGGEIQQEVIEKIGQQQCDRQSPSSSSSPQQNESHIEYLFRASTVLDRIESSSSADDDEDGSIHDSNTQNPEISAAQGGGDGKGDEDERDSSASCCNNDDRIDSAPADEEDKVSSACSGRGKQFDSENRDDDNLRVVPQLDSWWRFRPVLIYYSCKYLH